ALEVESLEAMPDEHLHSLAVKGARQLAPEVDVHARQQAVRHLHHRDATSEARVGIRELDADRAAADPHARRGQSRILQRLTTRLHDRAIDRESGQHALPAPSGEQDVPRGETLRRGAIARDLDSAAHGAAASLDEVDVVLAEERLDALRLLLRHG